jgi:hypothetical protein
MTDHRLSTLPSLVLPHSSHFPATSSSSQLSHDPQHLVTLEKKLSFHTGGLIVAVATKPLREMKRTKFSVASVSLQFEICGFFTYSTTKIKIGANQGTDVTEIKSSTRRLREFNSVILPILASHPTFGSAITHVTFRHNVLLPLTRKEP